MSEGDAGMVAVLASLCQLDTSSSHLGRANLNGENVLARITCGQACDTFY